MKNILQKSYQTIDAGEMGNGNDYNEQFTSAKKNKLGIKNPVLS